MDIQVGWSVHTAHVGQGIAFLQAALRLGFCFEKAHRRGCRLSYNTIAEVARHSLYPRWIINGRLASFPDLLLDCS